MLKKGIEILLFLNLLKFFLWKYEILFSGKSMNYSSIIFVTFDDVRYFE